MIVFEDDITRGFSLALIVKSCRSGKLDRGGFHGRFVSVPVIK